MVRLSLDQIKNDLLTDPAIYPQNLSFVHEAALILRLDRDTLESASFLDDRILTPETEGLWIKFNELASLLQDVVPRHPLHFIFHSGHVGSTLISRMIGEASGVLSLREPLPLRVFSQEFDDSDASHALNSESQVERVLAWFTFLWARGYADTQSVLVKATSSASRLMPRLLRAAASVRALCINLRAEPYLAALLAGKNSYIDLRGQASERYRRLSRLGAEPLAPLHTLALGEIAALTWLAETLTQHAGRAEHGSRILYLDFDEFLASPERATRAICLHFGLNCGEEFIMSVGNSPALRRYSKAPDRPFTPQLRAEILAESRKRNAEQINRGLLWLEHMGRVHPVAAAALSA